jgi:signal transduction histidine kinase
MSMHYYPLWLLCLLAIIGWPLKGQSQPAWSPQKRLATALTRWQGGQLSDTSYLHTVDSIVPRLLNDDSLGERLATYRQIAFSNQGLGRYRMWYYRYMAIYSINKNKYGSAIYYSERNNEEAIRIGVFEKEGIPHSDLFTISVYENNKDYPRLISKYNTLLPQLMRLPALIPAGKVSGEQGFVVLSILNSAAIAFFRTDDTVNAGKTITLYEKMMEGINKQPEKYKEYLMHYNYNYHMLYYERARHLGHFDSAEKYLQTAIREVQSPAYLKTMQTSAEVDTYSEAFDLYFDHGMTDSARRYLDLLRNIHDSPMGFAGIEQSLLLESDNKLLAAGGQYEAAYLSLRKLYEMKDSAFHAVSADKDNNLYALAEAGNARNELIRSETKQRHAEKVNFLLIFIFTLLAVMAVAGFFIYRSIQRQRMLHLRLSLARNFHDGIGPMLLYANTLAKKEMEHNASPRLEELKGQIMYIMEAVRGISHDLKSNDLSTVQTFCKDLTAALEKIRTSTGIDFNIRQQAGNRILSHLQNAHLRKIADELVSNSIKHGGCSMINLRIKALDRRLLLQYSDNGKGMAPETTAGGIGMQNMQERTNLLNGEFMLHNTYPNGYSIDISIPLL